MNPKFYELPEERRRRMINAGYRIFGHNSYPKSPMSEIAEAAGISKALLFHYFQNKKELYLFLWEEASQLTLRYLREYRCYESTDLFEMMRRGMEAKCQLMETYPELAAFVMKAYREKEPGIAAAIQESYEQKRYQFAMPVLTQLDPRDFRPGIDLQLMIQEMFWASEGYFMEAIQKGPIDAVQLRADFSRILDLWQAAYGKRPIVRKGDGDGNHTD